MSTMEKSKLMSGPILVLGLVQLIESLAFALPLSFFISSILGVLATTRVLLLIKEPEKPLRLRAHLESGTLRGSRADGVHPGGMPLRDGQLRPHLI
jgi:hypothetical protein